MLAALLTVLALLAVTWAHHAHAAEPARQPDIAALSQAAIHSKKAPAAFLLGVTTAGKRLVAVGERGIVLLSDDGGTSWRQAAVPVSTTLTAVHFADAKLGWAVGHLGVVLHSSDGGEHWVRQLDGVAAAKLAMDEVARMPNATDAQRRYAQRLLDDGPDKPFLAVAFTDRATGYVAGAGNLLFRTDDGGRSWRPWMYRAENPNGLNIYGVHAAGDSVLLVGERGLLLRSADSGASFQSLASPYKGSYFGVLGEGGGVVMVYGLRGHAYRSADAGASWNKVDTGIDAGLAAAAQLPDGTMLLASQSGDIAISRDHGLSFRRLKADAIPVTALAGSGRGIVTVGTRGVRSAPLNIGDGGAAPVAQLTGSK